MYRYWEEKIDVGHSWELERVNNKLLNGAEYDVKNFSGQLRWITASEICIILHILSPLHKYCFITQSNYCS